MLADVLHLSDGERPYVLALGRSLAPERPDAQTPLNSLLTDAVQAIAFPAYVITVTWDIIYCNAAFERIWDLEHDELPVNAVNLLFLDAPGRTMHGDFFIAKITPVISMVRSGLGRHPHLHTLQRVRDRFLAEAPLREIWQTYEIGSPFAQNDTTIMSPFGLFRYRTLNVLVPESTHGVVIQVPNDESRATLRL